MMEENEYIWCFLFLAVIAMVVLHNYPPVFTKGRKRDFTPPKKPARMPPKQEAYANQMLGPPQPTREPQRMQAVRQNFQQAATQSFEQFQPQQHTMPVAYQTAGMDPRTVMEPLTQAPQPSVTARYQDGSSGQMRYAQQPAVPQHHNQPPLQVTQPQGSPYEYAPQGGGPPPAMQTNPRRGEQQGMAPLMPQGGMATQQREMERFSLQQAATHGESMSGDNFFQSGGLSPANGSEWGSPI
jgi:hypothetical protein